ncbi:hypothetical protein K9N68_37540 (plasmid) [Kovacikia minuta CCNUW1]|uniref:hypothetical protein n=1 Tax=Kovacikia minuta TaxID=2931930 RepID=UPI001CCB1A93|nr:hypothetical protein [Kovacikia minuta]UBF29917.1 hypothetical protein K9N68_37540 [Kovacikia minuta CCNUW1]
MRRIIYPRTIVKKPDFCIPGLATVVYQEEAYQVAIYWSDDPLDMYDPVTNTVLVKEDAGGLGVAAFKHSPYPLDYYLNYHSQACPGDALFTKIVSANDQVQFKGSYPKIRLRNKKGTVHEIKGDQIYVQVEGEVNEIEITEVSDFRVLTQKI